MQIALLALGSRGDVQPFIALGLALERAGHSVRVIALQDYAELVAGYGLRFAGVVGAVRELMDFELVYQALDVAPGKLPLGFARRFVAQISPLVVRLCADCLQACADAELIIASTLGIYPGAMVAEKLGLPLVRAHLHPHGPDRARASLWFRDGPHWLPGRGLYHLFSHYCAAHGLWQLLAGPLNRARQEVLRLPKLSRLAFWQREHRAQELNLYGYSEQIAPRPAGWPAWRQITGYWSLPSPAGYQPPPPLVQFLAKGTPPVYLGFGSLLAGREPEQLTAMVVATLQQLGLRGLIYEGAWGDFGAGPLPDTVLRIGSVPHQWLFPQLAAAVIHGGAGTTAAALRAGVVPVIVPFFGDQRFWAERLHALGACPPPIPRAGLNGATLAWALQTALSDGSMGERVRLLGQQIASEPGVERAVQLIEGISP
jgi:sterol 3beta-glucosyltransferase